jgi:putative ABC transport system substrate-binding protein
MVHRRDFIFLACALPALARAGLGKPLKLAWFSGGTLEDQKAYVDAFVRGMKDLGYVEGRDFAIDYYWRGETIKPFSWLARDVAGARPDIIMATCEVTASAAKEATRTIPIVLTASTDPVANGIVPSLARPGGNVTGVSSSLREVSAKRVELLKELLPRAERVLLLRWKHERLNQVELDVTQGTARRLGMELVDFEAEDEGDFEQAFAEARKRKASAILDMAGLAWSFPYLSLLGELQVKHRVPAVHFVRELVERGGLLSYGPSVTEGFRRSAHYVDRLAKGARAADLPIEQPDRLELCVNLRTARALGITVPDSILVRADAVIG